MDKDISEYVLGSLDGFVFEWFDMLDKGKEPFVWEKFESAFRGKFIPKEHIQMAINKYLAIRQRERPISEYIVERERLEATLGKVAVDEIREGSFRKGLNRYMRDNMVAFRGLPYEEYKAKAEDVDQDAKECKVGHYTVKPTPSPGSKTNDKSNDKSNKNPPKAGKSLKKPQLSHDEMMKQGICFGCGEKGHISKKCPNKKKDGPTPESNSIRIANDPQSSAMNTQNNTKTPAIPTISIANDNVKPPPMFCYITIHGVRS